MTSIIVLTGVITTVLITTFKYKSEKKKEPNKTWKTVFADFAVQLLTVFLSTLIALTVNSYADSKKKDQHLIRFLDVAEKELLEELDYFSSDEYKSLRGDIYSGLIVGSYSKRNIKLSDILYSDRFIENVDADIASQISAYEIQYEDSRALLQEYLSEEADASGRKSDHDMIVFLAEEVVNYNVALIDLIECEKSSLSGRKYEFSEDDITKHVPEDVRKKYDAFNGWINTVNADSPDSK